MFTDKNTLIGAKGLTRNIPKPITLRALTLVPDAIPMESLTIPLITEVKQSWLGLLLHTDGRTSTGRSQIRLRQLLPNKNPLPWINIHPEMKKLGCT